MGGGSRPRRARSRSPTAACCSSTSCPSSAALRSTRSASRSRSGRVEVVRGQRTLEFPGQRDRRGGRAIAARARGAGERVHLPAIERDRYRRRLSGPAAGSHRSRLPGRAGPGARAGRRRAHPRARARRPSGARDRGARASSERGSAGSGALCNGDMDGRLTRRQVRLGDQRGAAWLSVRERFDLSGRGHDRVLRVARTIADLEGRERVRIGRPRRGAVVQAGTPGSGWRREGRVRPLSRRALPDRGLWRRIAGLLDCQQARKDRGLLALSDDELVRCSSGGAGGAGRRCLRVPRPRSTRRRSRPAREAGIVAGLPSRAGLSRSLGRPRRPAGGAVRRGQARSASAALQAGRPVAMVGHGAAPPTASRWPTRSGAAWARRGTGGQRPRAGDRRGAHRGCLDAGGLASPCSPADPTSRIRAAPRPPREVAPRRGRRVRDCRPGCGRSGGASRHETGSWPGWRGMTLVVEAADRAGA